ncbi:Uma2 family endonuclease [Streptosporangium carneum]|uniref:Uma2 family endonuclease n=1 Tax=Streptosporangium carneum TaxID=47481 RepID=UPI0022F312AB|nr:Uma2 family endonuclease [Streptosporangium carneum]
MTSTMSEETSTLREAGDPLANWPYPPPGGWTADDLDRLPQEGPHGEPDFFKHVELVDGALIFTSPQKRFHDVMIRRLASSFEDQVPDHLAVATQMDVVLGPRQRPCPDVLLIDAALDQEHDRTSYTPGEVHLIVEVVSPESEFRDREVKPGRYAEAGIPNFWRVEAENGKPVLYIYELDPATHLYVPTGIYHDKISLQTPFPIDLDLGGLLR